ncbi:hypothetical protein ALC62_08601 [Cyphomyrmex costatus]|uniref:Uncharacterized protein n=1 Tax=Cyphomyrmex costatus TaxID=456900 RepID=A0A151IGR5_9HYME|nr:hypothetical protein ALC62_08601 [Cyphomyrmex costatus]
MARDSRRADPRRVVAVNGGDGGDGGGGGDGDGGATVKCKLELILLTLLLTIIIPATYAENQVVYHRMSISLYLFHVSFFLERSTGREGTDKKTLKLLLVKHFLKSMVCTIYHINAEWFFYKHNVATIRRSIFDSVNCPTGRSMRCNPAEYCYRDCINSMNRSLVEHRASSPPTTANKAFLAAGGHGDFSPFLKFVNPCRNYRFTHLLLDSFQVGQRLSNFIQANKIIVLYNNTLKCEYYFEIRVICWVIRGYSKHDWLNDDKAVIRRQCSAYKATTFPFSVRSPASLSLSTRRDCIVLRVS